jgi:hypothetical protein
MRISKIRLAVPAAACAVVLGLSGTSAGAFGPSARVRPARHLTTGQVVTVHWHGFDTAQDTSLLILQCTPAYRADQSQSHCDLTNPVNVTPATRGGTTQFTVHTGTVGDGTCGTTADDTRCLISVTGIGVGPPPGPVPGESATAPIGFTAPVA